MTTLSPELLDELLSDCEKPDDLLGEEGLFKQPKKALLERALGAERFFGVSFGAVYSNRGVNRKLRCPLWRG